MNITIFTLFPEMFTGPLNSSILGRAQKNSLINFNVVNFRDYSEDKHRHVDDTPYGGGRGMVLKPEPIVNALEGELDSTFDGEIILLTPQGKKFEQEDANKLSKQHDLAFICGHYEGFDERIRRFVTKEFSIGDYVLTGGELPAMVMIDAIARLVPGVIKEQASYEDDSFFTGLLEYPHYTKPRDFRGMTVPDVLLDGHHAKIDRWRKKEALRRTIERRPDLLANYQFTADEKELLDEVLKEK